MSDGLDPDAVRSRTFSTARRGFERAEVEAFQHEVADRLGALQTELAELQDNLRQVGITELPRLKEEFDTVGEDVREILQAAHAAAEDMRDRADADATRWQEEAQAEAEALRRSAWETSEKMLADVADHVAQETARANEDVLFVRAEAEREALRLTGDAKRDAEELLRVARAEAEKVTFEARGDAERMGADAHRSFEQAKEQVRNLERRREGLLEELDALRETLAALEGRIAGRREVLSNATADPTETTVRVISDEPEPPPGDWLDDDGTVRLLPGQPYVPLEPVDADELAAEVESLRSLSPPIVPLEPPGPELELLSGGSESSGESAALDFEITRGDAVAADEAGTPDVTVPPEDEAEGNAAPPVVETSGEPVADVGPPEEKAVEEPPATADEVAAEVVGEEPPPASDDIDSLFASLREPPSEPVVAAEKPEAGAAEPPPELAAEGAPVAEEPVPEESVAASTRQEEAAAPPAPSRPIESGEDPWERRDRHLVPLTNSALRTIKREIVDVQNAVLEELRTEPADWRPKKAMFAPVVGPEAETVAAESYRAGVAASGEAIGAAAPSLSDASTHTLGNLVTDLWEDVVDAIDAAAGAGSRERGAAVGRIFRAWRTDEAERRVRTVAHSEYNAGMIAGLNALGIGHAVDPPGRDTADPDAVIVPVG